MQTKVVSLPLLEDPRVVSFPFEVIGAQHGKRQYLFSDRLVALYLGETDGHNEDAFGVTTSPSEEILFSVADGVGSKRYPERGSELAVRILSLKCSRGEDIEKAFAYVAALNLMTTLASVFIQGDHFTGLTHGDSRIYLLKANGAVFILTEDQSLASAGFRRQGGEITFPLRDEQARVYHEYIRAHLAGDALRLSEGYQKYAGKIEKGDRILVCSDGLWKILTWPGILGIGNASVSLPHILAQIAIEVERVQVDHTTFILYEH